jgi:hypothetical protein
LVTRAILKRHPPGAGYTAFVSLGRAGLSKGAVKKYGQKAWLRSMVKKKRPKRFRAVTAVKELARERVGAPPAGQIVVEKKKKPEKHKPTLGKLLEPD